MKEYRIFQTLAVVCLAIVALCFGLSTSNIQYGKSDWPTILVGIAAGLIYFWTKRKKHIIKNEKLHYLEDRNIAYQDFVVKPITMVRDHIRDRLSQNYTLSDEDVNFIRITLISAQRSLTLYRDKIGSLLGFTEVENALEQLPDTSTSIDDLARYNNKLTGYLQEELEAYQRFLDEHSKHIALILDL
jgi:hypothetical protein